MGAAEFWEALSFGEDAILLDGGLSNEMENRVKFDVHQEPLWTAKALIDDKESIIASHLAYLSAGADIIETSSYQATLEGFLKFNNIAKEPGKQLIIDSVQTARKSVELFLGSDAGVKRANLPLIAGSIGPYGVLLTDGSEYTGSYLSQVSESQLSEMHLPRIQALVEGGVNLIAIETMPALKEVLVILKDLNNYSPSTSVWVTFSIKEGDALHTAYGDPIKEAFEHVVKYPQVVAFGINCCRPQDVNDFIAHINPIRNEINKHVKIIVYPNSGQEWKRGVGWIKDPVPTLDTYALNWLKQGVNIIGGCCQVGTDQIRRLREVIDAWNDTHSVQKRIKK